MFTMRSCFSIFAMPMETWAENKSSQRAHSHTLLMLRQVNGKKNPDAAWYYPDPKPAAANIKDHVAFWKGVKVTK